MSFLCKEQVTIMSPTALKGVVFHYIPHQLLKDVDIKKVGLCEYSGTMDTEMAMMKKLLANSNNQLKMYGSPAELGGNLFQYRNFPSNHRVFGTDILELYNHVPAVLHDQNGDEFICKQDIFPRLQALLFHHWPSFKQKIPFQIVTICLKFHEERLQKCCEYVKHDHDVFTEIEKKIDLEMGKLKKTLQSGISKLPFSMPSRNLPIESVQTHFKTLFPNWSKLQYDAVWKAFTAPRVPQPGEKLEDLYKIIMYSSKLMVDTVEDVISAHPEMFLPNPVNTTNPITVRVFEDDGNQKFVMKSEVYAAINSRNSDGKMMKFEDPDGLLYTMDMVDLKNVFGSTVDGIEFISYPIKRTKHAAVPILTPSGDFCILASDALLQILRRLVFALKIFQKLTPDTWNDAIEYMKLVESHFSSDLKTRFFVTLDYVSKFEKLTDDFWKNYEATPTPGIRKVGNQGFTLEFIKQEIQNLGLPRIFPDILNYVEPLLKETLRVTRNRFLTDGELFDTLKHCQITMCFFHFPMLKTFLHTQKWRHPLCDLCVSTVYQASIYAGTKWNEYKFGDVKLKLGRESTKMSLVCPDVQEFFPSFSMMSHGPKGVLLDQCKNFMLDQSDVNWLSDNCFSEKRQAELLYSLDSFTKYRKSKKIYLRKLPTVPFKSNDAEATCGVFLEEVLEMIPILLKLQKSTVANLDETIEFYRQKLATSIIDSCGKEWCNVELVTTTISLPELEQILSHFDIDRNLITILPDPCFKFAEQEMLRNAGTPAMLVTNPMGYRIMHLTQAVFHIFQCVVCSIDWTSDYCNIHHNCLEKFRKEIVEEMRRFAKMEGREYVLSEYVDEKIATLRTHCSFSNQKTLQTPLQKIQNLKSWNEVTSPEILNLVSKGRSQTPKLSAWVVRLDLMRQSIDAFFDPTQERVLMDIVSFGMLFKVPVEEVNAKISSMTPKTAEEDSRIKEAKKEIMDVLEQISEDSIPIQLAQQLEQFNIQLPERQSPDEMEPEQPDYCTECIGYKEIIRITENELNDVQMQLKTAQNAQKSMEKKGKKSDELEKKLKDTERKMKGVEKELEKTKKNETAIKETMKTKLRNKDEQLVELQKNLATLESCASENLELQTKSEELEDSNKILLETIGQLTLKLNQTEDRLKMYSSEIQSSTVSSTDSDDVNNTKGTLLELQKIKDDFEKNSLMNDAKKMVDKLTTVTTDPLILQLGEYELIQLQGTINIYLETIEMNIHKIQKTNDVTDLFPLPKFPSISRKFLDEYWKLMDKQPSTSTPVSPPETGFSPKLVCYICHEPFQHGQPVLKCRQCKKEVHDKCGRPWIVANESCGYCRRRMTIGQAVRVNK